MSAEDRDELAGEFSEFGYRETDDPDEADRRNFYKVEKWDPAERYIEALVHASDLSRARGVRHREKASAARSLHAPSGHQSARTLAASKMKVHGHQAAVSTTCSLLSRACHFTTAGETSSSRAISSTRNIDMAVPPARVRM